MPSEYMFGTGPGHLPPAADRIAEAHGACVVNTHDAQCNCGYGCRPFSCKKSRRHWLCTPSTGSAEQVARACMDALHAADLDTEVE